MSDKEIKCECDGNNGCFTEILAFVLLWWLVFAGGSKLLDNAATVLKAMADEIKAKAAAAEKPE